MNTQSEQFTLHYFLDKRREKNSNLKKVQTTNKSKEVISEEAKNEKQDDKNIYPLKLTIYDRNTGDVKRIKTHFSFTKKEAEALISNYHNLKPKEKKQLESKYNELYNFIQEAKSKGEKLKIFSFELFEKNLKGFSSSDLSVINAYNKIISENKANDKIGTASNYECSLRSLLEFRKSKKSKNEFFLNEITSKWLKDYEKFMLENDKSVTTIGIYLRPLRAIFNTAISQNYFDKSLYPFHNKENPEGYKIPASKKVNKSLKNVELKTLFEAIPHTEEQKKAKAFWFFSYLSNGMNIKDIALLKFKDFTETEFKFYRAKTFNTTKENLQQIAVALLDFHKEVISEYGNEKKSPFDYVFPILTKKMNAEEQKRKINAFTRFINQHIKKLAVNYGLPEEISSYYARHSYASKLMKSHTSIEFIKQSLGHTNITTTQNYLSSFEDETKRAKAEELLNFD